MKRIVSALAIASCVLVSLPTLSLAQGLPGLTVFGGPGRENELRYRLDYNGVRARRDRYRLRVPASKLERAVSEFRITYPENFTRHGGKFDPDEIEVRVDGDSLPLDEVVWDQEGSQIEIYLTDPIPARTNVEIVFSDVQNPRRVGMHFFNASIGSPGDIPLMQYIGTWVIGINR